MKTIRLGFALALGVVLLGCEAQTPQSTATQPQPETAAPAKPTLHEQSHEQGQPPHDAADAEHQHDDMHAMLRLDNGQSWATDAALVEGMDRIRAAVTEASEGPALDHESAAALATLVRDQVNFLIANCQLEPDADATLHVFIAQLLNAAAALESDPASPEGLPQMQQTLREYPRYFSHPGWLPESNGEG